MNIRNLLLIVSLFNAVNLFGAINAPAPAPVNPYLPLAKTVQETIKSPNFQQELQQHLQMALEKYIQKLTPEQKKQAKELLTTAQDLLKINMKPTRTEQEDEVDRLESAKLGFFFEALDQSMGLPQLYQEREKIIFPLLAKYLDVFIKAAEATLNK